MRKLFQLDPPLHWDDDVPQNLLLARINLIVEALEHGNLEFTRSCKPVNIGTNSGATRLHCSQKFFEDLGFGRKFSGQTLLDLSLAMSPRSHNQFGAETFCL